MLTLNPSERLRAEIRPQVVRAYVPAVVKR